MTFNLSVPRVRCVLANSTKILLLCCLLGGCGSKGDLYLPADDAAQIETIEEAPSPSTNEVKPNHLNNGPSEPEREMPAS
jgi:predicted small lipoprotein YifL